MVVAGAATRRQEGERKGEERKTVDLPVIDISGERRGVAKLIVKACEEYGFFKVTNHGIALEVMAKLEQESWDFFGKPIHEKKLAGQAKPLGYGWRNIGLNGDVGEVEYLLLDGNHPSILSAPSKFSSAAKSYAEAVRDLACEILELVAEGLWVAEASVFSKLVRDGENDCLLRLNHYPPMPSSQGTAPPDHRRHHHAHSMRHCVGADLDDGDRVGFGEHSDPQILTILASNQVGGLQISSFDGVWIPVSPDPTTFCVNVGDLLQAMTNGRFVSVRHRALANSCQSRISMVYFAAPPLRALISSPPEMVSSTSPSLYRPFTWEEYKRHVYTLHLGDNRLEEFKVSL